MPGSHLFNLGLFQKKFNSTSRVTGPAINIGCTKGRGSTTRMFNYCTKNSPNPSLCINKFITVKNNTSIINDLSFLCYTEGRGPGSGILDTNFGWDSNGVWFTGDAGTNKNSYPIFTNFTISYDKQVEINVDFVYNEEFSDFGLCFYQNTEIPQWNWSQNMTRIACQYNGFNPWIYGLTSNKFGSYSLVNGNTYTCNVIYNPNSNPNITMNTKLNDSILNTITINNQSLKMSIPAQDYRIGFCADQDDMSFKTYITNLKINVNNGETIYESSLQNVAISPF